MGSSLHMVNGMQTRADSIQFAERVRQEPNGAKTLARRKHSDIIQAGVVRTQPQRNQATERFPGLEQSMIKLRRAMMTAVVALAVAATAPIAAGKSGGVRAAVGVSASTSRLAGLQSGCPVIFPDGPVAVAPDQPAVPNQSTIGIINALCDVTLDFVGCGFTPTSVALGCDVNGDGAPDISIPLKDIKEINSILFQATIPSLATTPGTAFPLVCCGGKTTITLSRTVSAGDDNIFGPFTQTLVCSIDLGIRAPVLISATPAEGDCVAGQNQLIPGACFVLADGTPNVTSVFGVEAGNPNNVIQGGPIQILTPNLIDVFFRPGPAQAGKTFLIYASGPNGTSRNLTALPPSAPEGCPLGNEQGVKIAFTCKSSGGVGDTPPTIGDPPIVSCRLDRSDSGVFTLAMFGVGFREGDTITIGGLTPKKLKFKDADTTSSSFRRMIAKGRVCDGLPGPIVYRSVTGQTAVFQCAASCQN